MMNFWQQLNNSSLLRFLLFFASGWAIVVLIDYFHETIAMFAAAGILAALLNYPVQWLSHYLPRKLAIPVVFLAAIAIILALITALGLEAVNQGQGLAAQITEALQAHSDIPWEKVLDRFNLEKVFGTLQSSLTTGLGFAQGVFSNVFRLIFMSVICLYMLIDGEKLWAMALRLIPANHRQRFASNFQHGFLGFIRGQSMLVIFLSLASFLVFSLLQIRYALLLAIIVALLDAIPGIGATLGVIVITLLVLASQGWQVALQVVIASILLQQIQDNFIQPKIMGRVLEINPVLIFLALFIGQRVAGILGVFLAIPIAGTIAAWLKAEALISEDESGEQRTSQ
jgi:predicted PurR-regulated permease PerM